MQDQLDGGELLIDKAIQGAVTACAADLATELLLAQHLPALPGSASLGFATFNTIIAIIELTALSFLELKQKISKKHSDSTILLASSPSGDDVLRRALAIPPEEMRPGSCHPLYPTHSISFICQGVAPRPLPLHGSTNCLFAGRSLLPTANVAHSSLLLLLLLCGGIQGAYGSVHGLRETELSSSLHRVAKSCREKSSPGATVQWKKLSLRRVAVPPSFRDQSCVTLLLEGLPIKAEPCLPASMAL